MNLQLMTKSMSTNYRFDPSCSYYFVTMTVVDWIDIFIRKIYKDLIIENLIYCRQNKGLNIHAYCLMSSHLHAVVSTLESSQNLPNIIRDFKKFTSRHIHPLIKQSEESRRWMINRFTWAGAHRTSNTNFQFWQHYNHPIGLDNEELLIQRTNYIHQNPVKAGWVMEPEGYAYSSARNYAGLPTIMEIDKLDILF